MCIIRPKSVTRKLFGKMVADSFIYWSLVSRVFCVAWARVNFFLRRWDTHIWNFLTLLTTTLHCQTPGSSIGFKGFSPTTVVEIPVFNNQQIRKSVHALQCYFFQTNCNMLNLTFVYETPTFPENRLWLSFFSNALTSTIANVSGTV